MTPPRRRMRLVWWMTWDNAIHSRFHESERTAETHVAELLLMKNVAIVWSGEVEKRTPDDDMTKRIMIGEHPELFERE